MGNVHAFAHRLTALSMAVLASAGVIFCALAGFSCDYLTIEAQPGRAILTPSGIALSGVDESASIGVFCESPFYRESDRMWDLSQIFLYIGLGLGGLSALVAWLHSTCFTPSEVSWRLMSLLGACAAVLEVPIFLIYESEPCNFDISRQTCSVGVGSYFNIASVGLFVVMTLLAQYIRPPDWKKETRAWRSGGHLPFKVSEIDVHQNGSEDMGTEDESNPSPRDYGGIEVVPPKGCDVTNLRLSPDEEEIFSEAVELESISQSQKRDHSFLSALRKTFFGQSSNAGKQTRKVVVGQVDYEDEEAQEDSLADEGVHVTIICPDGRKESAGIVRKVSKPANEENTIRHSIHYQSQVGDGDMQDQELPPPPPPEDDGAAPIAHLAIIPASRSEDDVSEITPLPDAKKSRKKKKKGKSRKTTEEETEAAMKILEDLARLEE